MQRNLYVKEFSHLKLNPLKWISDQKRPRDDLWSCNILYLEMGVGYNGEFAW